MIAEPTRTDGRPIISKTTSVTGRHMWPLLVFSGYGCMLVRIHLVHGKEGTHGSTRNKNCVPPRRASLSSCLYAMLKPFPIGITRCSN